MAPSRFMHDWYFLRDSFESFRLDPVKHRAFLFGKLDRGRRNALLNGIEESGYGMRGFKAVMYGDYGRGKTHQCHNLIHECEKRELPVRPVYVKCVEYAAKEPFSSLFSEMILALGTEDLHRVAKAYDGKVAAGEAQSVVELIGDGDVARVFRSLSLENPDVVRLAMKWLGGQKLDRTSLTPLGTGLPSQISVSKDFATVMKVVATLYESVDGRVPLFLIDEADQLKTVNQPDAAQKWASSLRALTELANVGYIFFVGANSEDDIPQMLVWDEVRTRIGAANYRDLPNPGDAAMRQWVTEFLQTFVNKGPVPEQQKAALDTDTTEKVPQDLKAIVGNDKKALEAFPFTPDAFDEFVMHSVTDLFANKPRELLDRIDRAAARAMRLKKRRIDSSDLAAIRGEDEEAE